MIRLYIWPGLAPPAALNPPHMMNFIYFILTDSQYFLLLLCFHKTTRLQHRLKVTTSKGSFTLTQGTALFRRPFFKDISPFCAHGHWSTGTPVSDFLVTSALDFKARLEPHMLSPAWDSFLKSHLWCDTCRPLF